MKRAGRCYSLCALLCLASLGCVWNRSGVDKSLMADRPDAGQQDVAALYRVGYPDVLALTFAGRPELEGLYPIDLRGCIDLGAYGRPRVQGRTSAEIAALVGSPTGCHPREISVSVAEYKSKRLYLFGQVIGWQRAVPYQGQETVLELLQRVGGITPGAEPEDVYVVRTHIAEGERPEVFHVKLADIVMRRDHRTNIRLQPDDQVFVGETRESRLEKRVPPWLRPLYHALYPNARTEAIKN